MNVHLNTWIHPATTLLISMSNTYIIETFSLFNYFYKHLFEKKYFSIAQLAFQNRKVATNIMECDPLGNYGENRPVVPYTTFLRNGCNIQS